MDEMLFGWMSAADNEDLPDGAWQAVLEDSVREFNKKYGTKHDPFDSFLEYCSKADEENGGDKK